ncbi:hypothetical protein I41_49400 [Lacipirellula limnantheis]|uniref:Uncharacterized protein n=1 Tax=Lacipirellula limnantheis TaxID=2528024 RepID=A0A517U4Y7_9BACT|nr:hypothetical protein I41_49400 [Lacipirellula limnantheis]
MGLERRQTIDEFCGWEASIHPNNINKLASATTAASGCTAILIPEILRGWLWRISPDEGVPRSVRRGD